MKEKVIGFGALALLVVVGLISGTNTSPNPEQSRTNPAPTVSQAVTEEESNQALDAEVDVPVETETAPVIETQEYEPQQPAPGSNCDSNYEPCVPNVSYDLDCSDISFSVTVVGSDPHRFDRDNDGYGCESN
jgi:hypothetical protein